MVDAGAVRVLWVQSPPDELPDILRLAVEMLSGLPGIVIEGNSAVNAIKPDIVVFVSGDPDLSKESAGPLLDMADIVLSVHRISAAITRSRAIPDRRLRGLPSSHKRIIEEKSINR